MTSKISYRRGGPSVHRYPDEWQGLSRGSQLLASVLFSSLWDGSLWLGLRDPTSARNPSRSHRRNGQGERDVSIQTDEGSKGQPHARAALPRDHRGGSRGR